MSDPTALARDSRVALHAETAGVDDLEEDGFTLVELIITGLLTVVVLGMLVSFYIGSVNAQSTVSGATDSSNAAQVASTTITTGIRNATQLEVYPTPTVTAGLATGDQLLVAQVARGGDTLVWRCAAWFYDASEQQLRYREAEPGAAKFPWTPDSTWTLLAGNVQPVGTAEVFTKDTGTPPGVSIAFTVAIGDQPPAEIATAAYTRAETPQGDQCF